MALPFSSKDSLFTIGTAGVTVTTTGPGFDVSQRQQILVVFTASGISTGNGAFTIDGSVDNSYWVTGISLQDAQSVSTSILTGLHSKTLSANGVWGGYVRPGWKYLRCKVTVTTDGRYTATLASAG